MHRFRFFLGLAFCLLLVGCTPPERTIDASAMAGVMNPVLTRHDAYVASDETITDVERDIALRSSALVRDMVNSALVGPP